MSNTRIAQNDKIKRKEGKGNWFNEKFRDLAKWKTFVAKV